jgi:hypothetical protein
MALASSFWSLTFNDNTIKNGKPESTNAEFPIITLTAANLVATETLVGNLENAVTALCIGELAKTEYSLNRLRISDLAAGSQAAQRENKWLMRYHGNSLKEKFRVSVGTADLTALPNHSEFLDLTTDPGLALKTAFEAVVRSPGDSAETVTLDSVQFVGRNT